jgi:hypothetical protein
MRDSSALLMGWVLSRSGEINEVGTLFMRLEIPLSAFPATGLPDGPYWPKDSCATIDTAKPALSESSFFIFRNRFRTKKK